MTDDERRRADRVPADRTEPVGAPVVRGDPAVTGDHAPDAVGFDPDDPASVDEAARTVRAFAESSAGDDNIFMLRGAAACAALVRGVGSYKGAAERAGGDVSVSFIRKWARVHDLPQSVRRHVARGNIAPTAAKHIARVSGDARLYLAWATLDADLTVLEVRQVASAVNGDGTITDVLADHGVDVGTLSVTLPPEVYLDLRRRASLNDVSPGDLVADALESYDG